MRIYSKNKEINRLVKSMLRKGATIRKGKKHNLLILRDGGRATIPTTPSDHRAYRNFNAQVRKCCVVQG